MILTRVSGTRFCALWNGLLYRLFEKMVAVHYTVYDTNSNHPLSYPNPNPNPEPIKATKP